MHDIGDDTGYTIGDLATEYGVSLRTLRFYEERELLRPRREGQRRVYTNADRARLEVILKAKRLGFSLSMIWTLVEGRPPDTQPGSSTIGLLGLGTEEIVAQLERLQNEHDRVVAAIEELQEITAGAAKTRAEASHLTAA